MTVFHAGLGFVMLLIGRQYYPAFVAGVSYLSIYWLIQQLKLIDGDWNVMWISLGASLVIGMLTYELRRWLAVTAAFIAGGYLLFNSPLVFNVNFDLGWPFFLLAGTMCALLAAFLFDFTLVALSALTAATMIVLNMSFGGIDTIAMFFVLVLFGAITQFVLSRYGENSPD